MEVHRHSHSSPAGSHKKWTHYFWEFFMLFLAVTLGFFVENAREHFIEHQREKQLIMALVDDLKQDTVNFKQVIRANNEACNNIDTLIFLLKDEKRTVNAKRIYYLARLIPLSDADLICQDKTFEQLKSSGGLRLIRNFATQNKIGNYYQITKFIETGPTLMQYQNRRDLFLAFDELFDASSMQRIMKTFRDTSIHLPEKEFILLNTSLPAINRFCMRYHIAFSTKKVVSQQALRFIKEAESLINFLSEIYHLRVP